MLLGVATTVIATVEDELFEEEGVCGITVGTIVGTVMYSCNISMLVDTEVN